MKKYLTLAELKSLDACEPGYLEFGNTFDSKATLEQVLNHAKKIGRVCWINWLITQNVSLARGLVAVGAKITSRTISACVIHRSYAVLKYLVKSNYLSQNCKDKYLSILSKHFSFREKAGDLIQILLLNGANPNYNSASSFVSCAEAGLFYLVSAHVRKGVNLKSYARFAIRCAVRQRHYHIALYLWRRISKDKQVEIKESLTYSNIPKGQVRHFNRLVNEMERKKRSYNHRGGCFF